MHLLALGLTGLRVHGMDPRVRQILRAILRPPPPNILDTAPAAPSSIIEMLWFWVCGMNCRKLG